MSPKFFGAALLMLLAAGYVAWQRSGEPPSGSQGHYAAPATQADSNPDLARLERRLVDLERRLRLLEDKKPPPPAVLPYDPDRDELRQRLESLEAQLRRIPDAPGTAWAADDFPLETENDNPESENRERLNALREAFENDDPAEPAMQTALENAAHLFETEELATLNFQEADCRANQCRLVYRDQAPDSAESAIAENELFLLLADKYGQGITIKGGERNGNSRTIYIELPTE